MSKVKKIVCATLVFVMIGFTFAWPIVANAAEPTLTNGATLALTTKTTAAATSAPYSDVTEKKVGKDAYNAIKYLKAHGGFKNVFTGKKFYPNKKITRRQFLMILKNLYGNNKVPVTYNDLKNANKTITGKYACDKMVVVAKKLGISMKWNGSNNTLTRAGACVYIKIFIDFDPALKPKK